MQTIYKERLVHLQDGLQEINKKVRLFSWLRLFIFTIIVVNLYFYFKTEYPFILLVPLAVLVVGFFYVIQKHSDIKYDQSVHKKLLEINQNEIAVSLRKPSFLSDGNAYHRDFSYTEDLDIFGPRSLYHMINRCFSEPGRKKLARWLSNPTFDKNIIWRRQRANVSVREMVDIRQLFLAHGLVNFPDTDTRFYPDRELIAPNMLRKIRFFRWLPPGIMLISIFAAVYLSNSNFVLYGFLINLVITGAFLKTTLSILQRAEHTLKNLKNYHRPLEALIRQEFTHSLLQEKRTALEEIYRQLKSLQRRFQLLESRSNIFAGLILNGFIGYDFIAVGYLRRWYESNAAEIPMWLDEIAFFESLFSLSTFAYNNPSYTLPLLNREMGITGHNIRHPFIIDEENVGNSLEFVPPLKVILLTGSNMSGKSTFLRSLGVNQVLAMAGSVVTADEFHTGLYETFSSFRKADSIQEHTSLFYDELKKLRYIITELSETKLPALILLDEILRGTNSDDKYYGSKQILLRLKDEQAMTLLATHDIALATLEEDHPDQIHNYSFESQITNGELNFDYKLHQGIAVNKNATFLMEKMGII